MARPEIKTIQNLESAFAGESMAHIKYRYFAKLARAAGDEDVLAGGRGGEVVPQRGDAHVAQQQVDRRIHPSSESRRRRAAAGHRAEPVWSAERHAHTNRHLPAYFPCGR